MDFSKYTFLKKVQFYHQKLVSEAGKDDKKEQPIQDADGNVIDDNETNNQQGSPDGTNPFGEEGEDNESSEDLPTSEKIDMVLDTNTGLVLVQMALDFISNLDNEVKDYDFAGVDTSINEENALKNYIHLAKMLNDPGYVKYLDHIKSDLTDSTGIQLLQKIISIIKKAKSGDIMFDDFRSTVDKKVEKGNVRETFKKLNELFNDVSIPF